MEKSKEIISLDANEIKSRIFTIRGKQVMLDSDLAEYFGTTTGNVNRAMKRNSKRFPESFCFQLAVDEISRCQIGISMQTSGVKGGRSYLPYVYTEQGIAMLTAVLRTERAIAASISIMEAFVEMRHFIANNAALFDRISKVELTQLEFQKHTEERFDKIFEYIGDQKETRQKIFYDGQIYDAFSLLIELVQKAEQEIILIDGYVDVSTLNLLAKKNAGVSVTIYTFTKTKLTARDVATFNGQYPQLEVKHTNIFHDRFLILDGKTVYHIGASLKDAGKKCFAISEMIDAGPELMKKLAGIK